MITLKDISKENLIEIIDLDVKKEQQDQVAPNSISIAEGNYSKSAWFKGIYYNNTPVGFVMLDVNIDQNECYLWRYMIDKKHQGLGYGKEALLKVIDYVNSLQKFKEIKTSYVPKDKNGADEFYRKIGFADTGKLEDSHEIGMVYQL